MARSDLLLKLVEAGKIGDMQMFTKTVEAIIAEERSKNHKILADRLAGILKVQGTGSGHHEKSLSLSTNNIMFEIPPQVNLNNLFLEEVTLNICKEFVEEHYRIDLLRSYNLEPRNRILLVGPPGNGKTSLAEAIASELMVPFITVRYEGIIGSYLGETASKLNELFDYVKTRNCVLFFDEFDTIGKERGDAQETGEIKRVVSSLLLQIDRLPSHVIVVCATNHPDLLDKAVWRRFQIKLELDKPNKNQIEKWLENYEKDLDESLGTSLKTLANKLFGLSFSELTDFGLDLKRKYVLTLPNRNFGKIVKEKLFQLQYQGIQETRGEKNDG